MRVLTLAAPATGPLGLYQIKATNLSGDGPCVISYSPGYDGGQSMLEEMAEEEGVTAPTPDEDESEEEETPVVASAKLSEAEVAEVTPPQTTWPRHSCKACLAGVPPRSRPPWVSSPQKDARGRLIRHAAM